MSSSEEENRRTILETGIKTEYDHESGLVQIVVISSAEYADISLDVARNQLSSILKKIGEPTATKHQPPPQDTPRPRTRIRSRGNVAHLHQDGPSLPRISQHRQQQHHYQAQEDQYGQPLEPYYYDDEPEL